MGGAGGGGPGATSGGAAVFFAGVVAEVDLEGSEDFEEGLVEGRVI